MWHLSCSFQLRNLITAVLKLTFAFRIRVRWLAAHSKHLSCPNDIRVGALHYFVVQTSLIQS